MASTDLSLNEQWLWLVERLTPGSIARTTATLGRRIRGPLDVPRLRECVTELIRRHETLRTTIVVDQGRLRRVVSPDPSPEWIWRDFSGEPDPERESRALSYMDYERTRMFDLSRGKQTRCMVARLSDTEHLMLFATHHLAADAASLVLLEEELSGLYAGVPGAAQAPPYTRFVERQVAGGADGAARQYWESLVRDAGRLDLDRVLGAGRDDAVPGYTMTVVPVGLEDRQQVQLGLPLSARVHELARTSRCSLYMVLLAALELLLYLRSGEESFLIRTPSANRSHPDQRAMIGALETHLFVRAAMAPALTFTDVLAEVRGQVMTGLRHHGVPMSEVLGDVLHRGQAASSSVALAGGVVQFALFSHGRMAPWAPPLSVIVSAGSRIGLASDLQVFAMEEGRRLDGAAPGIVLEANNPAGRYPGAAVQDFLAALRDVLAAVVADPHVRLDSLHAAIPPLDPAPLDPAASVPIPVPDHAVDGSGEEEQRLLAIAREAGAGPPATAADSLFPSPHNAIETGVRLVDALNSAAGRPGRAVTLVDLLERPTAAGLAAALRRDPPVAAR